MHLKKYFIRPIWSIYVGITGVIVIAIGLIGISAGIYIGGWVMLLGGFADTINLFKTSYPVTATDVAIALAKIIFAVPVGFILSSIILIPAGAIVETWEKKPCLPKDDDGRPNKKSMGSDSIGLR